MTTTHVFAELMIVGIETMAWIALLLFTLFGYTWIDFNRFNNLFLAVPLAAGAYVLGIITDRLSDALLFKPDHAIRLQVMSEQVAKSFSQLRSYVLSRSPHLSADLDYLRSSIINFALLGMTSTAFILTRIRIDLDTQYWAAVAAFLTGAILSAMSYYAWRASSLTYYLRLQTAFALLPEESSNDDKKERPESKTVSEGRS
jgi:hypothetical protein